MTQRKKPNKAARLQKRQEHADQYNLAFNHGFELGFSIGFASGKKEGKDIAISQFNKLLK